MLSHELVKKAMMGLAVVAVVEENEPVVADSIHSIYEMNVMDYAGMTAIHINSYGLPEGWELTELLTCKHILVPPKGEEGGETICFVHAGCEWNAYRLKDLTQFHLTKQQLIRIFEICHSTFYSEDAVDEQDCVRAESVELSELVGLVDENVLKFLNKKA